MNTTAIMASTVPAYWFRLPDDEQALMSMRPAELKCYLVVVRAIQRDQNGGRLSIRQIAERARVNSKHAHAAVASLTRLGRLSCVSRPGAVAVYSLPTEWRNRTPTGEQLKDSDIANCMPTGEQLTRETPGQKANCSPTGIQNCTPTGEQHLEFSEKRKTPSPASAGEGLFGPLQQSNELQPCADATRNAPGNGKPRATAASLDAMQERWFDEEFWPNYWRKVDKQEAKKAFKKHATSEAKKIKVVAAVKAQAANYRGRDPEHRPHASTWLNKQRYDDPPEEASPPASRIPGAKYGAPVAELPRADEYLRRIANENRN